MKLKQLTGALSVLLLLATACNKETKAPQPQPQPVNKLSKIEYDFNEVSITYNAEGQIANFISTSKTDPTQSSTYFVQYANGRLAEIGFGAKWKYHYTGNQLTKIESYNENGVLKYQTELVYAGNKVTEKIESVVAGMGVIKPTMKTKFHYNPQGNVSQKEFWQFVNNDWLKNEDIFFTEYDDHEDLTDRFEDFPFMPQGLFSTNNPKKEVYRDPDGTITGTITHIYQYDDKGRVTHKKSVHDFVGFPSFEEITKLFY